MALCTCARAPGAAGARVSDPLPSSQNVRQNALHILLWHCFILSPALEREKKKKTILNISESQPQKNNYTSMFFFLFCFVRIFFFPPPGSNREKEKKKGPHCSIVHIVSFFASEQRLFAAQLGTQWCSHKNEPLSSHTKLQIAKHCRGEARLSKFAYSHFPLLSSSYKNQPLLLRWTEKR